MKSSLFKLMALFYIAAIGHGIYKIFYDYIVEHHHNASMMKYIFYHDYMLQYGGAFIYSLIFLGYVHSRESSLSKVGTEKLHKN